MLGTFEVSHDGRPAEVRGSLPRRLLALLALTPGREVDTDRLVEGLWGDGASDAATATLHSHVARLRRDLGPQDVVRTGRHGYLLELKPSDVDSLVFEKLVAQGGTALREGRNDEASSRLAEALELWRGTPYTEFADCPILEAEAERLEALRLDALERRISADLGRAGIAPPVAELEALVRWHPMRESFWALLMAAQYRAGRQRDALASYQRVRALLADELGVDPGPALQELERLILAQDRSLDLPGMSTFLPSRTPQGAYPDRVTLLERSLQIDTLTALLDDTVAGSGRLVLVHGEAGVGKSALVREWCAEAGQRGRVLWGACDPLSSPRPLGPLVDVAPRLGAAVGEPAALRRARRPLRGHPRGPGRGRAVGPRDRGPPVGRHLHAGPRALPRPPARGHRGHGDRHLPGREPRAVGPGARDARKTSRRSRSCAGSRCRC